MAINMKSFGFKASILHGTKKLISSTKCNWNKLKNGALIQLEKSNEYFVVESFERILYVQPFTVKNRNCIAIKGNISPYILNGDNIKIVFNQHELSDEFLMSESGNNYAPGDLLFFDKNAQESLLLSVETTFDGKVNTFKIINRGIFDEEFKEEIEFSSERGYGFKMICSTRAKAEKTKTDRDCHNVIYGENETLIYFMHGLPPHVKSGEIQLNKWQCILNRPYISSKGDALNKTYKFFVELTPNYSFPMLLPNQENMTEFLNNFFVRTDLELKNLQNQLDTLKNG